MKRVAFITGAATLAVRLPAPASLYERVREIARDVPGEFGVYCRPIDAASPLFEYNEAMSFPAASTIKLVILATAYAMEERYPGTLDERIVTHRRDLIGGSDFMARQPDGARFSVRELLVPMITVSDNTASNYLISFFDFTTINAIASRAGMASTHLRRHFLDFNAIVHHNDNVTTPADMAHLLREVTRGARGEARTIIDAAHCRDMLGIMLRQTDRDAIPAALPPGTPIANKTGEISGTRNDVAVIEPFGRRPYVLAACTKWVTSYRAAYRAIHRAARLSFTLSRDLPL